MGAALVTRLVGAEQVRVGGGRDEGDDSSDGTSRDRAGGGQERRRSWACAARAWAECARRVEDASWAAGMLRAGRGELSPGGFETEVLKSFERRL